MSQLAWLLIPVVATVVAVGWVVRRGRPRGPVDAAQTVSAHQRFLAALSRQEDPRPDQSAGRARG